MNILRGATGYDLEEHVDAGIVALAVAAIIFTIRGLKRSKQREEQSGEGLNL